MCRRDVAPGLTAESLPVLHEALTQAERLLGLDGEDEAARKLALGA